MSEGIADLVAGVITSIVIFTTFPKVFAKRESEVKAHKYLADSQAQQKLIVTYTKRTATNRSGPFRFTYKFIKKICIRIDFSLQNPRVNLLTSVRPGCKFIARARNDTNVYLLISYLLRISFSSIIST